MFYIFLGIILAIFIETTIRIVSTHTVKEHTPKPSRLPWYAWLLGGVLIDRYILRKK